MFLSSISIPHFPLPPALFPSTLPIFKRTHISIHFTFPHAHLHSTFPSAYTPLHFPLRLHPTTHSPTHLSTSYVPPRESPPIYLSSTLPLLYNPVPIHRQAMVVYLIDQNQHQTNHTYTTLPTLPFGTLPLSLKRMPLTLAILVVVPPPQPRTPPTNFKNTKILKILCN